jgi:N-glycosylase/DNA lyase
VVYDDDNPMPTEPIEVDLRVGRAWRQQIVIDPPNPQGALRAARREARREGVEVLALDRVRPQDDLYEATSRPCRDASSRARCLEATLDRMVDNPTT